MKPIITLMTLIITKFNNSNIGAVGSPKIGEPIAVEIVP